MNHTKYGMNCFLNITETDPLPEGPGLIDSNNEVLELGEFKTLSLHAPDDSSQREKDEGSQAESADTATETHAEEARDGTNSKIDPGV